MTLADEDVLYHVRLTDFAFVVLEKFDQVIGDDATARQDRGLIEHFDFHASSSEQQQHRRRVHHIRPSLTVRK